MRWMARVALAAAVGAAVCGAAVACAPQSSQPESEERMPATSGPTADGPTFAAIGDSHTDADSPDFAAGDLGPASWARYVVDDGFVFAGGWAQWGATTEQMADAAAPIDADTLVVLAGTNDLAFGIPFDDVAANLGRIVDRVGIDEVVVVSIPPMEAFPEDAIEFNEQLEELADDRGWRFVDASAGLRNDDGRFREGMTFDGLHPSEAGARVLGEAIADELRNG